MKVLAYTSPARGHLYPVVPITASLAARGHDAWICTLADELGHLAEIGVRGIRIDPVVENNQLVDWRKRPLPRSSVSVLRTLAERSSPEALDLAQAIIDLDPDVLLIDINCWGAAAVAEASGLPWAMYCPYLLPLPSRDAPPLGLGLAPRGGALGSVRDALGRALTSRVFDRMTMPAINHVRTSQGLPKLATYRHALLQPPLLLVFTAEGFEYPRGDWPPNVQLVGPINWAPQQAAPEWLAQMEDPMVLVACSSERQDDESLIAVALQALPPTGMSVIATTAAHDPRAFDAPLGSKVVRFVAHEDLLGRAACVVCHGGMGITQKALAAGVPLVVVPFGRDQHETARHVQVANAGVRLPRRHLTSDRLVEAVHRAIKLRVGAQAVSRAYAAAGGAVAAANAIEALAKRQRNLSTDSGRTQAPARQ